jgi:hypothetical protein
VSARTAWSAFAATVFVLLIGIGVTASSTSDPPNVPIPTSTTKGSAR